MFIVAKAMVCPLGFTAAMACAAKRAQISAFEDLPYLDNGGQPIVGAAVPGLDPAARRLPRLLDLLSRALSDLLQRQSEAWAQIPLLVGLAEDGRPGGGAELAPTIVGRLEQALGVRFHPQSRAFASGHTAGFEALRAARRLFAEGAANACLVCGVDSLINASTLQWLAQNYRLKTETNRDGAIPGEAAAAVLLRKAPAPDSMSEIAGLGFGTEQAPILSEEPLLGHGMAGAVRGALAEAGVGMHEIDWRVSDVTGELYGFKELSLMAARVMRVVRHEDQPLWHWAEAIGDSGAAAGVVQLIAVDEALRKRYAPGARALCLTASVAGQRAAAVLNSRT